MRTRAAIAPSEQIVTINDNEWRWIEPSGPTPSLTYYRDEEMSIGPDTLAGDGYFSSIYRDAVDGELTGIWKEDQTDECNVFSEFLLIFHLNSQTGDIYLDGASYRVGLDTDGPLSGVLAYDAPVIDDDNSEENTVTCSAEFHVGVGGTMSIDMSPGGVGASFYADWGDELPLLTRTATLRAHRGPE